MEKSTPNKKVIVFTYYWPPAGGIMVQRVLKLCKYLPEFGWDPIVITTANGVYPIVDENLLEEVPSNIEVYKLKSFEPLAFYKKLKGGKAPQLGMRDSLKSRSLFARIANYVRANYFIPDGRKGFAPLAAKQAMQLIQKEKIDAIISTGPPHSMHLAALDINQKTDIPWIADFRDPWVNIYYNKELPRTAATIKKDTQLQNSVLQSADITTVVGKSLQEELYNEAKQVEIIYNGYDPENFPAELFVSEEEGKFRLLYLGNLLPAQDLESLIIALESLFEETPEFRKHFVFDFTGNLDDNSKASLLKTTFAPAIEIHPFLPYQEAIQKMIQKSSVLLLLIQYLPGKLAPPPGKLFDYIAAKTPVLGIGPKDAEAVDMLTGLNAGKVFDKNEVESIKAYLTTQFNQWLLNNQSKQFLPVTEKHLQYSRKHQAKQFADLLKRITSPK